MLPFVLFVIVKKCLRSKDSDNPSIYNGDIQNKLRFQVSIGKTSFVLFVPVKNG